jgi:hypothetical protein
MANDTQLQFQDITVSSHTVERGGRGTRAASRTNPSRTGKIRSDTNATKKVIKYTCDKTKVATMNGSNSRFPELKRNRTGWTVGTLHRIDGSALQPYRIVWEVEPVVSHYVGSDEMEGLVRHHRRCSARKLLKMFCVGMDLLWSCPETSNMERLRWVTVMFWDAAKIRYKILFRDGHDAWVINCMWILNPR